MSKQVKQMQMDALKSTFKGVKDMVVLDITGLNAVSDHLLRHTLRKKNIRLMQVKNSLARLAFRDLGIKIDANSPYWAGNTTIVWGTNSPADLCRSLEAELKNPKTEKQYKDKVKIKGGVAEGQTVAFDIMIKMPTREEAIANVVALALAPAARLLGQITGPGAGLLSQVKEVTKKEEAAPAEAPALAGASG